MTTALSDAAACLSRDGGVGVLTSPSIEVVVGTGHAEASLPQYGFAASTYLRSKEGSCADTSAAIFAFDVITARSDGRRLSSNNAPIPLPVEIANPFSDHPELIAPTPSIDAARISQIASGCSSLPRPGPIMSLDLVQRLQTASAKEGAVAQTSTGPE